MGKEKQSTKAKAKREIFAREYLVNGMNATQAAITAGYAKKTATQAGHMLLRKSDVREIVSAKHAERISHLDATADRILLELSRLAFLDPRKLFDKQGKLLPVHMLDDDTARSIAGIDHDELFQYFGKGQRKQVGVTTKIKLAQRTHALELLGKYRKLFMDNPPPRDTSTPLQINVTLVKPDNVEHVEHAGSRVIAHAKKK